MAFMQRQNGFGILVRFGYTPGMTKAWRLILIMALCPVATARADDPQPQILDQFGQWTIYRHFEGKKKPVCYMAAPPVKSAGDYKKRSQPFLMITHRPHEDALNVVSFVAGYTYDSKKPVMLKIDDTDFVLIPNKDMAWTPNQQADDRVTNAIKGGKKMMITGMSKRGNQTIDTFDLKGSAKAISAIGKACGVKKN